MIRNLFAFAFTVIAINTFALAQSHGDDGHTPNYCSAKSADVCAHLGHMSPLSSSAEVQFVAHVMTPQNRQVADLQVELWMPDMGHGSSPVELSQFGVNQFHVTKAYFIMPGTWQVRLTFSLDNVSHRIVIPLNIGN